MFSVWSELVSEGADTAIGAKRVVTAERALMSQLHALVHVLTSSFEVTNIISFLGINFEFQPWNSLLIAVM